MSNDSLDHVVVLDAGKFFLDVSLIRVELLPGI